MNYRLLAKYLGIVCALLGASMALSLPWAWPACSGTPAFESRAFFGLLATMVGTFVIGFLLVRSGTSATGQIYRKEAMAVVGLSWILASAIGAMPFLLSNTQSGSETGSMSVVDAIFESASGFTGTGATVISDLEDPDAVPRAILFWRSETHFLGGLGIMVLFVAVLGQGSAGKTLMMAEMPGPSNETGRSRTQHAAWIFTFIYLGLNAALTILLRLENMNWFDALCHSFGTIATGGFSTYNDSVAHFHSPAIEMTIGLFMVLACTNFTLLYFLLCWRPKELVADVEFRVYVAIITVATLALVVFGIHYQDFSDWTTAFRYSSFQVVSIQTNTGFATCNFDTWNEFGRATLFFLMYVGGCAGSTSCSIKVIRHILFVKILWIELERAWHPSVVRQLRVGGKPIEDPQARQSVLVYFGLILVISVTSWMILEVVEPDSAWDRPGHARHEKLMDCASGVAATLNGVGPGLGTLGAVENYLHFRPISKLLFVLLMILGRLEVFAVFVLFLPRFWRKHY